MDKETPTTKKRVKVTCLVCGKEFTKNRDWQKYCSAKCRKEAFNKRHNLGLREKINMLERELEELKNKNQ